MLVLSFVEGDSARLVPRSGDPATLRAVAVSRSVARFELSGPAGLAYLVELEPEESFSIRDDAGSFLQIKLIAIEPGESRRARLGFKGPAEEFAIHHESPRRRPGRLQRRQPSGA